MCTGRDLIIYLSSPSFDEVAGLLKEKYATESATLAGKTEALKAFFHDPEGILLIRR